MKILLAVDGSDFSVRAAREVVRLAREMRTRPKITLLNVDTPMMKSVVVRIGADHAARYHAENSELAFKAVRQVFKRARLAFAEEARVGDAGTTIADFATANKADLVVMGSHGRTAIRNLVMGSVVTRVIATGTTPVLVVR